MLMFPRSNSCFAAKTYLRDRFSDPSRAAAATVWPALV